MTKLDLTPVDVAVRIRGELEPHEGPLWYHVEDDYDIGDEIDVTLVGTPQQVNACISRIIGTGRVIGSGHAVPPTGELSNNLVHTLVVKPADKPPEVNEL